MIDTTFFIIGAIIIAMGFIIAKLLMYNINSAIQAEPDIADQAKEIMQTNSDRFSPLWDKLFMILFFGLMMTVIIASYFIDTHPIFLAINIILFFIVTLVGYVMQLAFHDIIADEGISGYAASFPLMNWTFNHFTQIAVVVAGLIIIVMFAKVRQGE